MTFASTAEKAVKPVDRAKPVLQNKASIRQCMELVGTMEACRPGTCYGQTHKHGIERARNDAVARLVDI